jgi:hypothetical protein
MKTKQEKQEQAKVRQAEYDKLTPKQKLMKLDLQIGDKGAIKQRKKLKDESTTERSNSSSTHCDSIPAGVGDSVNKIKKPYQKPKRS